VADRAVGGDRAFAEPPLVIDLFVAPLLLHASWTSVGGDTVVLLDVVAVVADSCRDCWVWAVHRGC